MSAVTGSLSKALQLFNTTPGWVATSTICTAASLVIADKICEIEEKEWTKQGSNKVTRFDTLSISSLVLGVGLLGAAALTKRSRPTPQMLKWAAMHAALFYCNGKITRRASELESLSRSSDESLPYLQGKLFLIGLWLGALLVDGWHHANEPAFSLPLFHNANRLLGCTAPFLQRIPGFASLSKLASHVGHLGAKTVCSGRRLAMPYLGKGMDALIASRVTGAAMAILSVLFVNTVIKDEEVALFALDLSLLLSVMGVAGGRLSFSSDLLKYVAANAALILSSGYLTYHTLGEMTVDSLLDTHSVSKLIAKLAIFGIFATDGWMRALHPVNTLPLVPLFSSLSSIGLRIPGYALMERVWKMSTQISRMVNRWAGVSLEYAGKVVNASNTSRAIGALLPIWFAVHTSRDIAQYREEDDATDFITVIIVYQCLSIVLSTGGGRLPFSADLLKSITANAALSLAAGYILWQTLGVKQLPFAFEDDEKYKRDPRSYPRIALGLFVLGALGYDGWRRALQPGNPLPFGWLIQK